MQKLTKTDALSAVMEKWSVTDSGTERQCDKIEVISNHLSTFSQSDYLIFMILGCVRPALTLSQWADDIGML